MDTTRHLFAGRALHVVDLDALVHGAPGADAVGAIWSGYQSLTKPGDAVVVGASHQLAAVAAFILPPSVRWIVSRSHPTRKLVLDGFVPDHAAARYSWLVVAGNDRSLEIAALEARLRGMRVGAVATQGQSDALRRLAHVRAMVRASTPTTLMRAA